MFPSSSSSPSSRDSPTSLLIEAPAAALSSSAAPQLAWRLAPERAADDAHASHRTEKGGEMRPERERAEQEPLSKKKSCEKILFSAGHLVLIFLRFPLALSTSTSFLRFSLFSLPFFDVIEMFLYVCN